MKESVVVDSLLLSAAMFAGAAYVYCRGDHWFFVVVGVALGVFFLGHPLSVLFQRR